LLERYPLQSWKPYAALARLAEQSGEPVVMNTLPLDAPVRVQEPEAGYWYALMLDRFPDDDTAALEHVLWLGRQRAVQDGLPGSTVSRGATGVVGGPAEASARLGLAGMDYLPLAAMKLAAAYPDSALAVDSALAALFSSSAWNRFLALNSWREVPVPRAWFWDAATLALAGNYEAARDSLLFTGPMVPGFEVAYTLATYEFASGRFKAAASNFTMAAASAERATIKARCMVRAGDALQAAGDPVAAADAYTAALVMDDFNPEAMAALRRLPAR
jgi:hypothetical protein